MTLAVKVVKVDLLQPRLDGWAVVKIRCIHFVTRLVPIKKNQDLFFP